MKNLKKIISSVLILSFVIAIMVSCEKEKPFLNNKIDECANCHFNLKSLESCTIDTISAEHDIFLQFMETDMYDVVYERIFNKEYYILLYTFENSPFKALSISIINSEYYNIEDYQILIEYDSSTFIEDGWWITEEDMEGDWDLRIATTFLYEEESYIDIVVNFRDETSQIVFTGGGLSSWEDRWDRCMRRKMDEIFSNWYTTLVFISSAGTQTLIIAGECAVEASNS